MPTLPSSVLHGTPEDLGVKWENQRRLQKYALDVLKEEAAAQQVRFESDTIRHHLRQNSTGNSPGLGWWPPHLRLKRSDLCTQCRAIDFEAAFTTPRISHQEWIHVHEQDTQLFDKSVRGSKGIDWPVSSNCQFCRYLANAVTESPKGKYTIAFHNPFDFHHDEVFIKVFPFSFRDFPQVQSLYGDLKPEFDSSFDEMWTVSNTIVCHRNKPIRKANTPQIVPPFFDGSVAQSWFAFCKREHTKCRIEDNTQTPKTKLIDCVTRRLVSVGSAGDQRPHFVALSYVWGITPGEAGSNKTRNLAGDLLMDVPRTIDDAIAVTKTLGFQYLWVDQYCIDQGDEEDQSRQIRHMDLIYKCAELTIVAAAGDGRDYGLPGVSSRRPDALDPFVVNDFLTFGIYPQQEHQYWKNGRWHTRGWTFQEALLSRRLLVFSDNATYFECRTYGARQNEMFGGVECGPSKGSLTQQSRVMDSFGPVVGPTTITSQLIDLAGSHPHPLEIYEGIGVPLFTYTELVTRYTSRSLSYASDGLNAFRGVANALQQFDPPVYSISGVPFVVTIHGEAEESLVEDSFPYGLSWRSTARASDVASEPEFPSWSWANVRVWSVTWGKYIRDDVMYYADGIHIEADVDGRKELCEFAIFAKRCRSLTPLGQFGENPTALHFKARILCSRFTSSFLDDKDELISGQAYSDLGHGIINIAMRLDQGLEVDTASTDHQRGESGEAGQCHEFQARCTTIILNQRLYEDMVSQRCSFVLLRLDRRWASMLVVEWLGDEPYGHQRTARRVGILMFGGFNHDGYGRLRAEQKNEFLRCFSIETDLRLI